MLDLLYMTLDLFNMFSLFSPTIVLLSKLGW
jgi:hypothetical protein